MPTFDGRDLPASQDSGEELALIFVFALCCEDSEILTQYNEELSQRGTRELGAHAILREHIGGQSGCVGFREGFLEEVISKMNPDR